MGSVAFRNEFLKLHRGALSDHAAIVGIKGDRGVMGQHVIHRASADFFIALSKQFFESSIHMDETVIGIHQINESRGILENCAQSSFTLAKGLFGQPTCRQIDAYANDSSCPAVCLLNHSPAVCDPDDSAVWPHGAVLNFEVAA